MLYVAIVLLLLGSPVVYFLSKFLHSYSQLLKAQTTEKEYILKQRIQDDLPENPFSAAVEAGLRDED